MKKKLTLLTGIVILITIMIAGACSSVDNDGDQRNSNKVTIYYKAVKVGGKMHLEMYNSYAPDIIVVDTLITIVKPGMKVKWAPENHSGVKKIKRIGLSKGKGKIFKEDASKVFLSKKFRLKVPTDASGKEKYDIEFEDMEENPWKIDPHLFIPDEDNPRDSTKKVP